MTLTLSKPKPMTQDLDLCLKQRIYELSQIAFNRDYNKYLAGRMVIILKKQISTNTIQLDQSEKSVQAGYKSNVDILIISDEVYNAPGNQRDTILIHELAHCYQYDFEHIPPYQQSRDLAERFFPDDIYHDEPFARVLIEGCKNYLAKEPWQFPTVDETINSALRFETLAD